MKFVFASYVVNNEFKDPESWLHRIRAYAGILESLAKNHEVISIEQIDYKGAYLQAGVQYHFKKFSALAHYLPHNLHRFIKEQKPDVVVIHGTHYPLQVIQLRFMLGKKTKIIVQNHAEQPLQGIKKYWQRWGGSSIDAYLFASREMGMDWVSKGNLPSAKKIHEVMEVSSVFHPIDKEYARLKTNTTEFTVFLWVGRLNQNKDPLTVVRAFIAYADTHPNARLFMIYHTDELLTEIHNTLKHHKIGNTVVLIGKVPNDELLYWYNSADFILSGSYYEGSGTAICEAMSCGCVPIVTNIFSFRMITNNGECGLLYKAGDERALLDLLLGLEQLDVLEKKKKSLAYFKSNLSFDAIAIRFEHIARSL